MIIYLPSTVEFLISMSNLFVPPVPMAPATRKDIFLQRSNRVFALAMMRDFRQVLPVAVGGNYLSNNRLHVTLTFQLPIK
jgi:hypothetical protein